MAFKKFKLYPRVVTDLKKRSALGIIFYPLVLMFVLFPGGYYASYPDFSLKLSLYIGAICLFRLLHLLAARWLEPKFVKTNNIIFFISVILTGLIWGVGYARFMSIETGLSGDLLIVMCTIGLSAGGTVAFLPDFRVALLFCSAMLLPAIFMMAWNNHDFPLLTAHSLMLLYLCFMVLRGNREYWDALENEYLLEKRSLELEKISRVDGLTCLYNRRYFDEVYAFEWNRSVRKQLPMTVIIADIDNFKLINDRYGHLAGDEYLKALSRILGQVFKRSMDIIARYGGEEFVILMPEEPGGSAVDLCRIVKKQVQNFVLEYDGQFLRTTLSLGVASMVPEMGKEPGILISKADEALYKSKVNGRNRVTVDRSA